jgi:hypothetical protein
LLYPLKMHHAILELGKIEVELAPDDDEWTPAATSNEWPFRVGLSCSAEVGGPVANAWIRSFAGAFADGGVAPQD